jgi:hypothetical protein
MRRILRKILAGEEDQLGDISTVRCLGSGGSILRTLQLSDPSVVEQIIATVS